MNQEQLVTLRALAQAATPGPWRVESEWTDKHSGADVVYGATGQLVCQCDEHDGGHGGGQRNAAFIAACSPDTIIALLDDLSNLSNLRALLDTPWPADEEGNEPKPITFSGGSRASFFVNDESGDFVLTADYAIQLGAALIRAAVQT